MRLATWRLPVAAVIGEWKVSNFEQCIQHAQGRRIVAAKIPTPPLTHLVASDVVRFDDGTAVACQHGYEYQCGTEYTPETETEPACWWIYS